MLTAMLFSSEKVFRLLKLYFPEFSVPHFCKSASRLEQAQWLYQLVYQARFEFVSHFLFGPFTNYIKSGEEFLEGLFVGQGGVCLERVMALRFLIELFDIGECSYVLGGSLPGTNQPIDIEAVKASLLDPQKVSLSPYAHHAALVVKIDNKEWLLDANAGRLGQIFLNPSLTEQILTEDVERKLGVHASFGQMFYTRAPEELFHLTVAYRRGTDLEAFNLLCLLGILVGPNYDVFIIPKEEVNHRVPKLYPHRVQTMCWQIEGNLLEGLSRHQLIFANTPGKDHFFEKMDSVLDRLNRIAQDLNHSELKLVLRIATKPWGYFTEVAKALPKEMMMH
ncbi:MAG: hypothetical protein S4CHLAM45_07810 [Chlamydiales bacterium]|nr:hypothetical protein [Chlamydiales bacterium]MCH9620009.1 hypothetical protein [Chlamydiales bacterium]MCH9622887.1 hypothetical protein [Chlamydiales bacterium]